MKSCATRNIICHCFCPHPRGGGNDEVVLMSRSESGEVVATQTLSDGGEAAVAWEQTTLAARADDKKPAWALIGLDNGVIASGEMDISGTAAVTVSLADGLSTFELLWIVPVPATPLVGVLQRAIFAVR